MTKIYPTCPRCGSDHFSVEGYIGYHQLLNAKARIFGPYDEVEDEVFPIGTFCGQCRFDVTPLFESRGVLKFYTPAFTPR